MGSTSLLVDSFLVAGCLKVLLFPAYHSTDFEVHRNWLALTSSLPISEWYYEATSEWTLDYPPFFAYFEWALAQLARYVDPDMLRVSNLGYASWATVAFQRATVMASELVLLFSLMAYVRTTAPGQRAAAQAAALSVLLSPGLLIIDHIHFQYNGMMYGMMIFSLVLARRQSSPSSSSSSSSSSSGGIGIGSGNGLLASGVLFGVLLCFKHIYAYVAPAYAAFLLGAYCQAGRSWYGVRPANAAKLAVSLAAVLAAALGPFAYLGQLPQLLARLFPFQRGLTHAYWAPNAWALYSFLDRVLISVAPYARLSLLPLMRRFGIVPHVDGIFGGEDQQQRLQQTASLTRGLVGDVRFAVLPDVSSGVSGLVTVLFMLPALFKVWLQPTWRNFVSSVTLCAYSSFLFGYHVHEKAILLVIVPFSLIALTDRRHLSAFRPLANAGYVSLFPLLFDRETTPVKIVYTLAWLVAFNVAFERLAPPPIKGSSRIFLLDRLSLAWDIVALPLVAYSQLGIHEFLWGDRFQFLPLMFMSTYCALGVVGSWIGFMVVFFTAPNEKVR